MSDPTYKLIIRVDEETLRDATDAEEDETVEGLIDKEFGWLNSSGVILESIEKIKKEDEDIDITTPEGRKALEDEVENMENPNGNAPETESSSNGRE